MECLMDRDEIMSFGKGLKGVTIRCEKGAVWLTVAGEGTDHVLMCGDQITVTANGKAVVVAQELSTVLLYRSIAAVLPSGYARYPGRMRVRAEA